MTISIDNIVNVNIAIGAPFPRRAGFGTLNIVTAETGVIGIAERSRLYNDIDGVANDWPSDSEALVAATSYFSQNPRPTSLIISTRYPEGASGQVRGGSVSEADELLQVSDGSFSIWIDGAQEDITALDFTSGQVDLDEIADVIALALLAVGTGGYAQSTCSYDGSRFIITSGTSGATSEVSFLSPVDPIIGTDISSMLRMRQGEGTSSVGVEPETITDSLNAIEANSTGWYGLVFTKEVRDNVIINGEDAVEAAARWCEARVKTFGNTTNDLDALDTVSTTHIGSVLNALGMNRTMTTFCSAVDSYPSASIMGRAFTVDFGQPDSTITLKFKQIPGISAEQLSASELVALASNNVNALISVGGYSMFSESNMASGLYFDEIHGVDWLQNAIQTNVFGYLLSRETKVPYTNKGVAAIEQQLINALDEAVRNGLISAGYSANGEFLARGYKTSTINVEDVNPSDREARFYSGLSFIAIGSGAIHAVQINGTFER